MFDTPSSPSNISGIRYKLIDKGINRAINFGDLFVISKSSNFVFDFLADLVKTSLITLLLK